MSKITATFALLSTLAFTTANTPTYQLWADLPSSDLLAQEAAPTSISDSAPYAFAFNGLNQELSEDDALDRFEVDEFYLPRINVELPELFDWSELESTYLASESATFPAQMNVALDNDRAGAFRFASLSFGGGVGGGDGGVAIASSRATEESASIGSGKGSSSNDQPSQTADDGQELPQAAPDELIADNNVPETVIDALTPASTTPALVPTIVTKEPVQVPTPGTYGLFALGLAGLRLASRKKNRSG